MKRLLLISLSAIAISGGAAFGQEFRTTPRAAPQSIPAVPQIEKNSNSSILKRFWYTPNRLQLVNPFAPKQYGSGAQVLAADVQDPRERPKFWKVLSIAF
jgi:hypothetical protein